jgi:2-oxo-4-hydroxy-4-carboxy-5-ureidoimidazoline decarboxylase
VTIVELNSLDRDRFVAELGWIFEHSPWVAERAWTARPFAGVEALHAAMVTQVEQAAADERLALLRAHPDLGSRARISPASAGEQTVAGLDCLTPAEFTRLEQLNTAYKNKFGFPFVLAVKACTKYDVLRGLEQRLESPPDQELREAFFQVHRIARFRLLEFVK